jgi:hypothetical protein
MDDDLMFGINHGNTIKALDHPLPGLHLGALIVGDVALYRRTSCAGLVVVVGKEGADLPDVILP